MGTEFVPRGEASTRAEGSFPALSGPFAREARGTVTA
jgi:hypothetical protein